MPTRTVLLAALLCSACGDDSTATDLAPPDLKRVIDLTGPRSGIGTACTGGRGPHGSCQGDDSLCLTAGQLGVPGGYCTQSCDTAGCPSDAECVQLAPGFSLCLAACNTDADCRSPDYVCTDYNACTPKAGFYLGSEVPPGTLGGAACVSPAVMPPNGSPFDANQQLSILSGGETHVAVDEASGNVVVAWIQLYPPQDIAVVASHDHGATWDPPILLPRDATVDSSTQQSDPVVAVDSQGRFFVTWIGFDDRGEHLQTYVARSLDGGASWPDLTRASPLLEWATGFFLDKPWMAVGPDDSIYVTWSASASAMGAQVIRVVRSTDHGDTWSAPVTATPDENVFHNLAEVAVGPDGSVYIAGVELNGDSFGDKANRIALQRLTADLQLDGPRVVISAPTDSPPFDEPSLAVDGDSVYVAYVSGTPLGAWDLRVAASTNRGTSFAAPVTVNDDPSCATHMHPAIAIDGGGRAHVVFYDNRYGTAALMHAAASAPASAGALKFGANAFVNDAPFTFTTERNASDWLGDYPGIAAAGAHTYVVWTDNRVRDTSQIFFSRAGF